MNRNREMPTGLQVIPSFQIFLHIKDRALLERIQRSLGEVFINMVSIPIIL